MTYKNFSLLIMICILLCCNEKFKSETEEYKEIQKQVIKDDKFNIKDGKAAINHFNKKCKDDYNKSYYSESEGRLKYFDCSTISIHDDDVKYLVFFPELTGIHVTGKGITDKSLNYIKEHSSLNGLGFIKTSVTGVGIKYLKKLTKLEVLIFEGSTFTDEGCKYLSEIKFEKPINEADFSSTKITDEGLKYLSGIKFNGALMLKNTAITDAGLKYLANQKELGELYLNNTRVTKEGIKWLEKQLPDLDIRTRDKDI